MIEASRQVSKSQADITPMGALPEEVREYLDLMSKTYREGLRLIEKGGCFSTESFGQIQVTGFGPSISLESSAGESRSTIERLPEGILVLEGRPTLPLNIEFVIGDYQRDDLGNREQETLEPHEQKTVDRYREFQKLVSDLKIAVRVVSECSEGRLLKN
ncbi:MAG: hypothetical protein KDD64_07485 [Bdellovibrionales bacterium]|nr:hypothetical protein [Bdellovibrionales bacterium]